jgi:hypothetical protein
MGSSSLSHFAAKGNATQNKNVKIIDIFITFSPHVKSHRIKGGKELSTIM